MNDEIIHTLNYIIDDLESVKLAIKELEEALKTQKG